MRVTFTLALCLLFQGGVFIGLVTLFFTVVEVKVTITENTDWEISIGFDS